MKNKMQFAMKRSKLSNNQFCPNPWLQWRNYAVTRALKPRACSVCWGLANVAPQVAILSYFDLERRQTKKNPFRLKGSKSADINLNLVVISS